MVKRLTLGISMLCLLGLTSALSGEIRKSADCTIPEAGPFERKKILNVELENNEISVVVELRYGVQGELKGFFVVPHLTNLTGKPRHASFHAAFSDNKGELVVCVSFETNMKSTTKDFQFFNYQPVDKQLVDRISKCEMVVYTSEPKEESFFED